MTVARARETSGPQRVQPTQGPRPARPVSVGGAAAGAGGASSASSAPGLAASGAARLAGRLLARDRRSDDELLLLLRQPEPRRAPAAPEFRVSPPPRLEVSRPARAPVDAEGRKPHESPELIVRPYPGRYRRPMASQAEHRKLFATTQPGTRAREHVRKKARFKAYKDLPDSAWRRIAAQLQAGERSS